MLFTATFQLRYYTHVSANGTQMHLLMVLQLQMQSISAISAAADDETLSMVSAAKNMTIDKYCEIFLTK